MRTAKGYRWGRRGRVYPTRRQALRQARAIRAQGYRKANGKKKKN